MLSHVSFRLAVLNSTADAVAELSDFDWWRRTADTPASRGVVVSGP
jgi:hypothetical protein